MEVIIEVKNIYGNEMFYPVNETAKDFAKLTNSKTLSAGNLSIIQGMGYTIITKQPEYKF